MMHVTTAETSEKYFTQILHKEAAKHGFAVDSHGEEEAL